MSKFSNVFRKSRVGIPEVDPRRMFGLIAGGSPRETLEESLKDF